MGANENLFVEEFAGRYRDIDRRLNALERMPTTFDLPFIFEAYQNYDSTGRAIPVVDAAWVLCFITGFPLVRFPGILATLHVLTPPSTTAEVRLTNYVGGGASSTAIAVPANTDLFVTSRWLHSQPMGTGPFQPSIECRRTSGAGTVLCFRPITPMLMTQQSVNLLGGYSTAG